MLNILVAEDQLLLQKDLCIKLKKARKDINIVGTALNGKEAYEKIKLLNPDILFTDIKMPIESGLDLIERLKKEGSQIKTVILSGYRDFEFARKSLKLGVDEYLLKPISVEDLTFTLDNLAEKIYLKQEEELLSSLNALIQNTGNFSNPLDPILPKLQYKYFYSVLIHIGSVSTLTLLDTFAFYNPIIASLKAELCSDTESKEEALYFLDGFSKNETFLLFCLNSSGNKKTEQLIDNIKKCLKTFDYPITLCISKKMSSIQDFGINSKLMSTQVNNQLKFGVSSILYQQNFLDNRTEYDKLLTDSMYKQFLFNIQNKNLDGFIKLLSKFLLECEKQQITQKSLDYHFKKILFNFFEDSPHQTLNNISLEIDEYLSTCKNYTELNRSLLFLFKQLFKGAILNIDTYMNPSVLTEKIKDYIHANYSKEINIQDIALQFSITPAYLSRLFKKQEGIRPIEYLTNYRIEQSCRYFTHSGLSIREVAELCGYSNQFYFSKAFKHLKNISPSEYRIQYQKYMDE